MKTQTCINEQVRAVLANHPDADAILAILEEEANAPDLLIRKGYAFSCPDPQDFDRQDSPSPEEVWIDAEEGGELTPLTTRATTNFNVAPLAHWNAPALSARADWICASDGTLTRALANGGEYRGNRWRGTANRFDPELHARHVAKCERKRARHGIEFCWHANGTQRSVAGAVKAARAGADNVALARKLADATARILRRDAQRTKRLARIAAR